MEDKLIKGFSIAKRITRKYAKAFYFSSLILPKEKRYAAYAIYALCRLSDHAVDDIKDEKKRAQLTEIKRKILICFQDDSVSEPLLLAFQNTIRTYQIPKEYFDELISGMELDLIKDRYASFDELYNYCFKVAGVIGLIMLKIFGSSSKEAEEPAIKLGIAMQLTNIIRDIKEDYARGRVYLPNNELSEYNVKTNMFSKGTVDRDFTQLLQFQILRARKYYQESAEGIKLIDNLPSRLAVCLMRNIYSEILSEVEKNNYDVFGKRNFVSLGRKILILAQTILSLEYY